MVEEGSAQHANSISECIYSVSTQYAYTHMGVHHANSIRSMRIHIWVCIMPIAYRGVYMVYLRSMRIHIWVIWRSNIWGVL
jgi:hypothetical protein